VFAEHASDAWRALVEGVFHRRRGTIHVLDEPCGHDAPLWPLVHVLWAGADLRLLGKDVPIDAVPARLGPLRRGDAFAPTKRTRSRYFDDNAWLGLAALRLSDATHDPSWPPLARSLSAFVATGEHPDGGLRWREGSESRNTCSTASAAWLTGSLDDSPDAAARAGRWLDWLERTLRRRDGLFADRVEDDRIEPHAWSYNQGAVVAARHAIGRSDDGLVDAMIDHWDADRLWREPPPFLAITARALLGTPSHRDAVLAWLDPFLGRLVADGRRTIDQAAIVQLFALRAGV
jgi:hypothetical protein